MANEVPGERAFFFDEDVQYRAAVSESLLGKVARTNNFINRRHVETMRFKINGNYGPNVIATPPFLSVDGIHFFDSAAEIANIIIYNRIKGTAGETKLDIKWKAQGGSTWTSIFTGVGGVVPKFDASAADYDGCGMGATVTGFTAAVPVKTQFAAGDMIRMDLMEAMTGNPSTCGLIVHIRPR